MAAITNTSSVKGTIDVIEKYEVLVKNSLDGDSCYIRAKETMEQMFQDSDINSTDKASAISTIVGNMVNAITSASMTTALEWAKYEKELALKKLELDHQLAILGQEEDLKNAQVEQVENQTRLALVESRRMYGTPTFDVSTGALLSLTDEGKVWSDMQLVEQQTTNAGVEEDLLSSKVEESKVAIHKIVADTYVNYGNFKFTYEAGTNGISTVTRLDEGHKTLSDTQRDIAIEQGKGYSYNAWANALTGSASMLGTAIASDYFDFSDNSKGTRLLETVLDCAQGLKAATTTVDDAIPVA